jgi:hypothetical protein
MSKPTPPKELDAIADVVLAYRPKPKSKPGKKRRRMASKIARDSLEKTIQQNKGSSK